MSCRVIVIREVGAQGPAGGGGSTTKKAGIVSAGSFSGSPKKYAVTFSTAYANTNYIIDIKGADARFWSYESKATTGFVINSNAATALTGEVSWFTTPTGETS